jgi:hypothetical protein
MLKMYIQNSKKFFALAIPKILYTYKYGSDEYTLTDFYTMQLNTNTGFETNFFEH